MTERQPILEQRTLARPAFASSALTILAIVGVAVAVRVLVLIIARGAAIDMDGSEYVRVAENLVAGRGPVGMRGFESLVFPPLYSWSIAALLRLGADPEFAALGIAAASGIAFAALLYALARTVYDRPTALYAGLIGAVLPACVQTSTNALSEAPFAAFVTAGLVGLVRLVRGWSRYDAALCGAAFGAAYLLRPEGALFVAAALGIAVFAAFAWHRRPGPLLVLAAGAVLLMLPGAAASYALTGHVVLEGKSAINFSLAKGLRAGSSYLAVADRLDAAGRPVGPEIDPRFYAADARPPQLPLRERSGLVLGAAIRHVADLADAFRSRDYGAGLLVALGVVGFVGPPWPWSRARRRDELVLLAYCATAFLALAAVWHFWPRYGNIMLPVVIVWAARGVTHVRRWSEQARIPDLGLAALAVLLVGSVAIDVARAGETAVPLERSAGAWIAAHGAHGLIVDVSTRTAFYAGATWSPLPYADERATTRYLDALRPAYIVFDSRRAQQFPPLRRWFAAGLPPSLGERAYVVADGHGRTLKVYRFSTQVPTAATATDRNAGG